MTHLDPSEFVDLLDGRLDVARARHADECLECRERSGQLRRAAGEAAALPPAEPSPLFWGHLSARVSDAIGNEPRPSRFGAWSLWFGRPAFSMSLALAVMALVALAAVWTRPPSEPPEHFAAAGDIEGPSDSFWMDDDVEADDAWALVRAATDAIEWDEAAEAGLALRPGAVASAVDELTEAERNELARLIEDEIKRTGA